MTISNVVRTSSLARTVALGAGLLLFCAHARGATVVAKVGATSITREALDRAVQQSVSATYFHKKLDAGTLLQVSKARLEEMIRREHAALAAGDAGMPIPVADARKRCAEVEKQLGPKGYAESLQYNGWTRDQHIREVAKTLLAEAAYRRFVTIPSAASDADVRKAYDAAPSRWTMPESVRVQHILIRASGLGEDQGAEAEARAASVAARVRKGEDFAKLAAEFSADDYRVKGGELGWVHRGRLVSEVDAVVFAVEPGSVPAPIRSGEGWHVVRVLERRPARQLTFEEAAPQLRKELEKQKLEATEAAWFASLRKKYPVTILDPSLR
ncbi:MAG: peptidylprolyl isomerase [Thermoanaerobaculia bacterium]